MAIFLANLWFAIKSLIGKNGYHAMLTGKKLLVNSIVFSHFRDCIFDLLYTLESWIRWFSIRSSVCEKLRDYETFFITVQFFKSSMKTKIWHKKHFFYLFCSKFSVCSNVRLEGKLCVGAQFLVESRFLRIVSAVGNKWQVCFVHKTMQVLHRSLPYNFQKNHSLSSDTSCAHLR